ncbi:MAG TPA: alpha/beta hydrolase [Polyangiaceae bacterium]|nr:alpha/beta hydrolase [Polyangiaceae bacterium]
MSARAAPTRLSSADRVKVRYGGPLIRRMFRSTWLRQRLLRAREADLARGLDPDIALLLVIGEHTGDSEVAGRSPGSARRSILASVAIVEDLPRGAVGVRERELRDDAGGVMRARLYEPEGLAAPSPGFVFIHGGGWVVGDLDTHDTLCRRLALEAQARVLSVEPRLAPEHPFPAAVYDSLAAFRYAVREASALGLDPARLGIAGDSAGGNLSAVVGQLTRDDAVRPKVTLLIYPAVDATRSFPSHRELGEGYFLTSRSIDWYLDQYAGAASQPGHASRTDPLLSPLHAPDLTGAPPALVVVAGFDPLRDEGEAYAEKLLAAGVAAEVLRSPSLPHGFALMTGVCGRALRDTERFARRAGELLRA